MQHVNSWKNKEVFRDQLSLNESELSKYPEHWNQFLNALSSSVGMKKASLLDLGCGAGVYKEVCKTHFPTIDYTGMDYSQEAIEIAKERWGGEHWRVGSYESLTLKDADQYDILHAGAMLDVLPNGDEALEFLLGLGFTYIILGRCKLTGESSYHKEYTVYNKIQTYAYAHNSHNMSEMFKKYGYEATYSGDTHSCTILLQTAQ